MLREFAPSAVDSDWELTVAGQRVQVIRRDRRKGGVLEFGTTVVGAADGSIAGLLGASPGASTAVPAMLDVLERCFADRYQSWLPTLKEMVPSLGAELSDEPALYDEVWSWGTKVLELASPMAPAVAGGRDRHERRHVTVALRRSWAKDLDAANALRAAQAAGGGVRRRTGHRRIRNWTGATCSPKPGTSGWRRPTAR